jgi:hypothetical protein
MLTLLQGPYRVAKLKSLLEDRRFRHLRDETIDVQKEYAKVPDIVALMRRLEKRLEAADAEGEEGEEVGESATTGRSLIATLYQIIHYGASDGRPSNDHYDTPIIPHLAEKERMTADPTEDEGAERSERDSFYGPVEAAAKILGLKYDAAEVHVPTVAEPTGEIGSAGLNEDTTKALLMKVTNFPCI